MNDPTPVRDAAPADDEEPMLDALLRDAVPEIKLALGDLIDRENSRALPDRYARLMPETTLAVALRPDAAQALLPVAAELEREMTDSCMRHGSLYDRDYRVKLRHAESAGAPLFRVTALTAAQAQAQAAEPLAEPPPDNATSVAWQPDAAPAPAPAADDDATRFEHSAAPAGPPAGRYEIVAENAEGAEICRCPITDAQTTVGRRSDNAELRSTVMLPDVPHVSRRQLALVWQGEGDAPFRVINIGLNPVHVGDVELPGANVGKGPLRLDDVAGEHATAVPAGTPMRIGEQGPTLRIEQAPVEPAEDPDATRFG